MGKKDTLRERKWGSETTDSGSGDGDRAMGGNVGRGEVGTEGIGGQFSGPPPPSAPSQQRPPAPCPIFDVIVAVKVDSDGGSACALVARAR